MRKRLLAIFVLVAAFVFGGTASAQTLVELAERAVINAQRLVLESQAVAEQIQSSAPLAIPSHQPRATIAPVFANPVAPVAIALPAVKPPVIAAHVEKPKAVEQAKAQAPPAKPQLPPTVAPPPPLPVQTAKPAEVAQDGVKVYAMKVPLEKDTTIRGTFYKKDEPLWAIVRETKDGRIVDKNGKPTNDPELAKAPPRGAEIVPFKI